MPTYELRLELPKTSDASIQGPQRLGALGEHTSAVLEFAKTKFPELDDDGKLVADSPPGRVALKGNFAQLKLDYGLKPSDTIYLTFTPVTGGRRRKTKKASRRRRTTRRR